MDPRLILLNPIDNILVLAERIEAGEVLFLTGSRVVLNNTLDLGHKIARNPIRAGEDILKYGIPIGYAREDIHVGAHVHVHNIASRYTAVQKVE